MHRPCRVLVNGALRLFTICLILYENRLSDTAASIFCSLCGTYHFGQLAGAYGAASSTGLIEDRDQVKMYVSGCFSLHGFFFLLALLSNYSQNLIFHELTFAEVQDCHFCVHLIPPDTLLASADCTLVEFYSRAIDLVGRVT